MPMGLAFYPSSWSNLPLDLLLIIKKKLELYERSDLASFRSVCSHWCSTIPTPNHFPCYKVNFDDSNQTINFVVNNNTSGSDVRCSINLSMLSSTSMYLFCLSNGWVVFKIYEVKFDQIYIFDPVSNHKCIFPPLSPENIVCHQQLNSKPFDKVGLALSKVIVSSNTDEGIAVGGIVLRGFHIKWLVFCRLGDGARWNLFMEEENGIVDIALAGDGRFYCIGENWDLYVLEERPQFMRLKKFILRIPKRILEPIPEYNPIDKFLDCKCTSIEKCDGLKLTIYGCFKRCQLIGSWIRFKLDMEKLYGRSNIVDAFEAELHRLNPTPYYVVEDFKPLLGKISPKVEEQSNKEAHIKIL